MSEPEDIRFTPEAERARASLQATEPPRADPSFRERLKEDFVSGRIAERRGALVAIPPHWYARRLFRAAAVAAAAAVLIVAGALLNRGPAWRVIATTGAGVVQVDGEPIAIEQVGLLRARIRPGVVVSVPAQGEVEIVSDGRLAIQLTPGTQLTLPPPPSRWIGRSTELHAREGELRITTGPAFLGGRLEIHTPDAVVQVNGSTLAVIIEPTGTCVCVLEGEVRMGKRGEQMQAVLAGRRGYAFRDGRPLMTDEIRPMESSKLAMFRDSRRPILESESSD